MSYEPTTWKSGDIVTSDKLNKMEQGIANAGGGGSGTLVCTADSDGVLDHTYQEVADAGFAVYSENFGGMNGVAPLAAFGEMGGKYSLQFLLGNNDFTFAADSADGYPVMQQGS